MVCPALGHDHQPGFSGGCLFRMAAPPQLALLLDRNIESLSGAAEPQALIAHSFYAQLDRVTIDDKPRPKQAPAKP